jgi:hypothetical protein
MDRKITISIEETDDYGFIVRYTYNEDRRRHTHKTVYKINKIKKPENCMILESDIKIQLADIVQQIIKNMGSVVLHFDWTMPGFCMDGFNANKFKEQIVGDK